MITIIFIRKPFNDNKYVDTKNNYNNNISYHKYFVLSYKLNMSLPKKYFSDNIGCHKYHVFADNINILSLK